MRAKINTFKVSFKKYFSHQERSNSQNVDLLNILVHNLTNLFNTDDGDIILVAL